MDRALNELEADPRVTFYLLPLPSGESKRHQADPEPVLAPNKFMKGGKGKKGKGQVHASAPKNLPEGKMTIITKTGKRVCWNYGLPQGCQSGVKDGQSCDRGLHICAEPRCVGLIACKATRRVGLESSQNSCKGPRRVCLGRVSLRYTS